MSGEEHVMELNRPKSSLLDAIGRTSRPEPARPPEAGTATEPLLPPEELVALPKSSDAYEPHSRPASRPLATIFFLGSSGLPDGFSYAGFERVRMVEQDKAGGSPALLMRFNGSVIYEVLIEGRNLRLLCDLIGRQVIHWVREHPNGRDEGGDKAVFVRRIAIREIERD